MIEFRLKTSTEFADNLSDQLTLLGADAVTTVAADTTELTAHAADIELIAYVENDALGADIATFLSQQTNTITSFTSQSLDNQDWVRMCLDRFVPQQIGDRLWICPSWHEPPEPYAVNVILDPGLAFGTGTHPTTKLCLAWLDKHIHGNEEIIDYGCGSGILAIAALKLGAKHVTAIDNDQHALAACLMNLDLNHLAHETITISAPNAAPTHKVDILIANILATPLIELATLFTTLIKPGGKIVLSGILPDQIDAVIHEYAPHFTLAEPVIMEEWVRIDGVKKQ